MASHIPILASSIGNFGQCLSLAPLTPIQALNITCFDAVDYAFFLPIGFTLEYFESIARSKLSDPQLNILPTKCKSSIKKAVCSNIYLKCPTNNFNISSNITWNYKIFSDINVQLPVPFQRPCVNVCHNANNDCLGILKLFNLGLNCSEQTDYSHGIYNDSPLPYKYDQANNDSICNNMSAVVEVSSSSESYTYGELGGACSGVITSLYVSQDYPNVAPMQPPYIIQALLENQTYQIISNLPSWLSSQCHLSLRKYICGTYMLQPQVQNFGEVLLSNGLDFLSNEAHVIDKHKVNISAVLDLNLHVPGYPQKQICQNYGMYCEDFITNKFELLPSPGLALELVPKCDKMENSISLYPLAKQTVLMLSIVNVSVIFESTPNMMTNSSDSGIYETVCPQGYVVPDTPESARNRYVLGTGCALGCRIPFLFTNDEFEILESLLVIVPAIGLPLIIALIITWAIDKKKRSKGYLVLLFAIGSAFYTLLLVLLAIIYKDRNKMRCVNNAIQRRQSDGFSVCVLQGMLGHYISLACTFCWMLQAIDLVLKICLSWQGWQGSRYFRLQMAFIFGVPCIFVTFAAYKERYGYGGNVAYCLFTPESTTFDELKVLYYPATAAVFVGGLCMIFVIVEIIRSSKSSDHVGGGSGHISSISQKILKKMGAIRTSILFVVFYFLIWISVDVFLAQVAIQFEELKLAARAHLLCTYIHFDKNHPEAWRDICGILPADVINFDYVMWLHLTIAGQSILISGVYMNAIYAAIHEYIWPESSNLRNEEQKGNLFEYIRHTP